MLEFSNWVRTDGIDFVTVHTPHGNYHVFRQLNTEYWKSMATGLTVYTDRYIIASIDCFIANQIYSNFTPAKK